MPNVHKAGSCVGQGSKAQPGFFRDLMCSSHKAEASSWAFCRAHQKLTDVHSMCETCLLSSAADNKSDLEMYQSLLGKLGVVVSNEGYRNDCSLRYGASEEEPVTRKDTLCSCCSRQLNLKSCPFVVLQNKVSGMGLDEVCRGVPRVHQRINDIDYVAYSELKTSDSESEPWQFGGDAESLPKDDASDLKEDIIFYHPQTNIAKGIPLYGNPHEKVPGHSELVLAQNGCSYCRSSEERCSLQTNGKSNILSTDLSIKHGQQITEDSDRRVHKSIPWVFQADFFSTFENARHLFGRPFFMEIFIIAAWQIWKQRNNFIFDRGRPSFDNWKNSPVSQLSNTSLQLDAGSPSVHHQQREQAIQHNISRALSFQLRNNGDSGVSKNTVSEVEVECTTDDQLKRQIELDRRSIRRLWEELEEERNASAVAASETMAMIARLQEEKAALRMEALQCQRMMEEQSKYVGKNLQKMTSMVQTLEAENEGYKVKLRDQLLVDEIRDHMGLSCPKEHEPATISRVTVPKRFN